MNDHHLLIESCNQLQRYHQRRVRVVAMVLFSVSVFTQERVLLHTGASVIRWWATFTVCLPVVSVLHACHRECHCERRHSLSKVNNKRLRE
jgi:hypothetical protein